MIYILMSLILTLALLWIVAIRRDLQQRVKELEAHEVRLAARGHEYRERIAELVAEVKDLTGALANVKIARDQAREEAVLHRVAATQIRTKLKDILLEGDVR